MEAGADLEQGRRPARARSTLPSVGSVIRERIFSSVLLPAPLRPMTPTTSPCPDVEAHVAKGPELLARVLAGCAAAAQEASRSTQGLVQALGQASVPKFSELIALPDRLGAQRDRGHQIRSAKRCSTRWKNRRPVASSTRPVTVGITRSRPGALASGSIAQRNVSSTPTSGLSA